MECVFDIGVWIVRVLLEKGEANYGNSQVVGPSAKLWRKLGFAGACVGCAQHFVLQAASTFERLLGGMLARVVPSGHRRRDLIKWDE